MLNRTLIPILLILAVACSADPQLPQKQINDINTTTIKTVALSLPADCSISRADIQVITGLAVAKQIEKKEGVDSDSYEALLIQTFLFNNGDKVVVEQKFCDMYNLSVNYTITKLNKASFQAGLDNIDLLLPLVKRDYKLKSPLKLVVNMLMNQKKLNLDNAFDITLPDQAVASNGSVEHNLAFKPDKNAGAQLEFYLGLGGE